MMHRRSIRSTSAVLTTLATAALLGGCGGSGANPRPPPPAGLQVTGTTASTVTLSWNATANATGYTLERRTGSAPYVAVTPAVGTATTYTDTGLSSSTVYTYHLNVTTAAGTSPYSAEVTATTTAPDPTAPTVDSVNVVNGISGTPEHVILSGTASARSGTVQGVSVDWGDSTPVSTVTPVSGTTMPSTFSATHDYGASGSYTVTITATDSAGRQATDTRALNVTRFQTGSQAHFVFQDSGTASGSQARDFSGNKRNGTYTGSGCFSPAPDRYSVADQAERFNPASNAACTVSVSGGMTTGAIPLPGAFTVNLWLRPDAGRLNQGGWLAGQKGGAFRLTLGTDGRVSAHLLPPGGGPALTVTDPAAVPGDAWTHYAATLSTTGSPVRSTLTLYRDGTPLPAVSQAGTYALAQSSAAWTVADMLGGSDSTGGNMPFSGALDDLRLYDRALAGYEISALFRLDRFPKP